MANDWSKNPIVIDTAEHKAGVYNIKMLEWHPGADNDDLEVRDSHGNMLWKVRASMGAPNSEDYAIQERSLNRSGVQDIHIVTIDGGVLYIHII